MVIGRLRFKKNRIVEQEIESSLDCNFNHDLSKLEQLLVDRFDLCNHSLLGSGGMTRVNLVTFPKFSLTPIAMKYPHDSFVLDLPQRQNKVREDYSFTYFAQLAIFAESGSVCQPFRYTTESFTVDTSYSDSKSSVSIFGKKGVTVPLIFEEAFNDSGWSLHGLLKRDFRVDPRFATLVMTEMARTVKIVHDCGYNHLDIKPSNIVINSTGAAKLIDFGLATFRGENRDEECLIGTPKFMDPYSYITGRTDYSDAYQLALTLERLVRGENISLRNVKKQTISNEDTSDWAKRYIGQIINNVRGNSYQPLRARTKDEIGIIDALNPILERALKFDPKARHQSIDDLYGELLEVQQKYVIPQLGLFTDLFNRYGNSQFGTMPNIAITSIKDIDLPIISGSSQFVKSEYPLGTPSVEERVLY